MRYSMHRALQKIWIHKNTYIFISLELILSITIVMCGFLSSVAAQKRIESYKRQNKSQSILIQYASSNYVNSVAISTQDYKDFAAEYGHESEIMFLLYFFVSFYDPSSDAVENAFLVSMNDTAFKELIGVEREHNTVYIGSMIAEKIDSDNFQSLNTQFSIGNGQVILGEEKYNTIEKLNYYADKIIISITQTQDLDINKMIIFPEEKMETLENNTVMTPIVVMGILASDSNSFSIAEQIMAKLNTIHTDYVYNISDQFYELKKSIEDLTINISFFTWIAYFSLIVTTIGLIGVFLIFLEKRKREIAIMLMMGSTLPKVYFELFSEIFLINFFSGMIGIAISASIAPYLSTNAFIVTFRASAFLVMMIIITFISLFSSICTIFSIKKISPVKILREL